MGIFLSANLALVALNGHFSCWHTFSIISNITLEKMDTMKIKKDIFRKTLNFLKSDYFFAALMFVLGLITILVAIYSQF